MDAGVFLLMFLVGAGLLFWGLWQIRAGRKKLDKISGELDDIGKELDDIQKDVKETMSKLYREGREDS